MTTRNKIFFTYTIFLLLPLLLVLGTGGYLNASKQAKILEQQAQTQADTMARHALTASKTALEQGLRNLVDNNQRLFTALDEKYRSGSLSQGEAQWLALDGLIAQRLSHQGRLFCIDNQGLILAHTNKALANTHLDAELLSRLRLNPAGTIITVQHGTQPATLYTKVEFLPWNWTIVASFPLAELAQLLSPQHLAQSVMQIPEHQDAQPFLLDATGSFWPPMPAPFGNLDQRQLALHIRQLGSQPQDPGTTFEKNSHHRAEQRFFVHQIPELNLIAGIIVPTAQLNQPFTRLYRNGLLILLPATLLALGLIYLLAQRLGAPYTHLAMALNTSLRQPSPALPAPSLYPSTAECEQIVDAIAQMLTALHNKQQQLVEEQETNTAIQQRLHQEISTRREAENKLRAENSTRRSAETYLQLFKNIFDSAIEGIYITDPTGRILATNQAFTRITGYQASEMNGQHPMQLASNAQIQASFQTMWAGLSQSGSWAGEIWNRKKDGSICPLWLSVSVIRNDRQEITNYFAFFHDISELKRKEKQISILAYSDALTKLPNRAALEHRLTKAIARATRERRSLAVFFIDLDNFKNINDSLGHDKGDQVLVEVAERLSATIRSEDTLCRLGGDEFILLSESVDDDNAVYNLGSRILAALKQPVHLRPNTIYINASIGIALFPDDGRTTQELIKNADMAMYKAKSEGKNKFVMFTREMNDKLLHRIRIENSIRTGLKQHEFFMFYQPKIDISDERTTSLEALIRWQRDGTIITPDQFIPIAEDSGLIDEMSLYVLDEVCIFLTRMQEQQLQCLPISVNMSPRTFNNKNIVETIDTILGDHRVDHRLIEFEITETTAMKDVQHTLETMRRFRQRGIRFSIDDFGTGYSSLSYLSEMPVSTLKIDKRFINTADANSRSIVSTITAMSKQMQLNVVAEGVETIEQLQWLKEIGCDEVQGYYFSRPMPEADTLNYLHLAVGVPQQNTTAPVFLQ